MGFGWLRKIPTILQWITKNKKLIEGVTEAVKRPGQLPPGVTPPPSRTPEA